MADVTVRNTGYVLAERLRADTITNQCEHLATDGAARSGGASAIEFAGAAWAGECERTQSCAPNSRLAMRCFGRRIPIPSETKASSWQQAN